MTKYNRKEKITKVCKNCNNTFVVLPSRTKKIYCTRKCLAQYRHKKGELKTPAGWNKGKPISKEWKKKLREAKLKNPVRYWLGKERKDLRKPEAKEWRELRKQKTQRGVYQQWRKKIYERDNYTCALCRKRGVYLEAHHIKTVKENPELELEIKNGITLCKKCHNKTKGKEKLYEKQLNNMAQRCIKCRKGRKTKKGLCAACRPTTLGSGYIITTNGELKPCETQTHNANNAEAPE